MPIAMEKSTTHIIFKELWKTIDNDNHFPIIIESKVMSK